MIRRPLVCPPNALTVIHSYLSSADPETFIEFPKTINIPSKIRIPTMTLLGVGVRRVSVLKVKVYSIGFYADLNNPDLKVSLPSTLRDES